MSGGLKRTTLQKTEFPGGRSGEKSTKLAITCVVGKTSRWLADARVNLR